MSRIPLSASRQMVCMFALLVLLLIGAAGSYYAGFSATMQK